MRYPGRANRSLALFGTAYVALVALAAHRPSPFAWGVDLPGFLPLSPHLLVLGLMIAGLALLWAGVRERGEAASASSRPGRKPAKRRIAMPAWALWALLAGWAVLLWFLRVKSFLLGDQALWLERLSAGTKVSYSEPLSAWTWRIYHGALRLLLGRSPDPVALAALPVLCGVLAALLLVAIARELSFRHGLGWYVVLVLLTGTSQLFFGYIETYPLVTVSVLLYLWLGLRYMNGKGPLIAPALALALAVSSHLAVAFLAPSYLLLVFSRPMRPIGRVVSLAIPAAVIAGIFALLAFGFERMGRPIQQIWSALEVAAASGPRPSGGPWPPLRVALDLGNLLLLVSAVPTILIVQKLASSRGGPPAPADADARFLGWAAIPGFLVACLLCVPGTPAQDWDLLAVCVLPLTVFGPVFARDLLERASGANARRGLALLSLGGLLAFVLTNADAASGARRFEMLMSEGAALSPHERAYGHEKLGDYYTNAGDRRLALVHEMGAVAADSADGRNWGKVGTTLYATGRYPEAIAYFSEAVNRGAPRGAAYYYIGNCYLQTAKVDSAIPYLWRAVQADPDQPSYSGSLGMALIQAGRVEQGRAVWQRALARWPNDQDLRRAYQMVFGAGR